jgi:hypothetical protein
MQNFLTLKQMVHTVTVLRKVKSPYTLIGTCQNGTVRSVTTVEQVYMIMRMLQLKISLVQIK